jgi:serine/threonine-protein kinase
MPLNAHIGAALLLNLLLVTSPSLAAEPTKLECVSASENGQALQHEGKLRAARAQFAVCVVEACPGPVRDDCAQHLADVDKASPTVVFVASDASGNERSDVAVTMDGEALLPQLTGRAISLDPGLHTFVFTTARGEVSEKTLVLHEGEKDRRERVVVAFSPTVARVSEAQPSAQSPTEGSASNGSTQRVIGLALGGAGVVGLVVGSVMGIVSKSTYNHALSSECGTAVGFAQPKTCNQSGYNDVQSAYGQATASTIAFVAGAALIGGGAYFYLSAPKGEQISVGPSLGPRNAGIALRATW